VFVPNRPRVPVRAAVESAPAGFRTIGDMLRTVVSLARSTHPGPAIAVTVVTVVLAIGAGLEPWRTVVLGVAMLAGQASVGLSNDWIDADRDRAVGRSDKPVALGLVSRSAARAAAFATAGLAIVLTVPLGWVAVVVHALFIISAWLYNVGLKRTALSVLPYIVSFGLLPLLVTVSASEPRFAAAWALGAGALLGVSAHFANVLPDLDDDASTGVRGLPHRIGLRVSGLVVALALVVASALVVFGAGLDLTDAVGIVRLVGFVVTLGLAVVCAALALRGHATRLLFQLIIAAALIDVTLLALAGAALPLHSLVE